MASLLKNQILKHLSKFTKNLSSDKINLSTFKGEGELSNLELNEDILTHLLELPSWLRITKAVCNRVAVKIQWTKLKSQPICLYLDEVIVETETCQELRPPTSQNQQAFGGKYGFVDRVMDGIFVHVNSVVVKLTSHKFQASLQLSRVQVQSMTPKWQKPSDLRSTRIRDATRGEILLFKEIEWQTTRIEATAVDSQEESLTPLRLIANQAKIRIVVKKRLSDSAIISSRLILLLDDLLWVLTITQLKAAILYANSLKELIERSSKQSKAFAAEKLKKQGYNQDSNQPHHRQQQRTDRQESSTAKLFRDFDVVSTSYHLITSRFDLHLCDDRTPDQEEKRHWKVNGGSMQITFYKLSLDMYPYHPAGGERKSWYRYSDNVGSRNPWVQKLFAQFREEAVALRQACESEATLSASSSAPSLLAVQQAVSSSQSSPRSGKRNLNPASSQSASTSPVHGGYQTGYSKQPQGVKSPQSSPSHQGQGSTRLLESCFVVKMEDVTVYMVNTPGQKRKSGHQKLLASDKRQLHLPPEMSVFHLEYTDYFFPDGLHYPVPHANLYVLINPVRITMDYQTVLWTNIFMNTLSKSLDMDFSGQEAEPTEHVDTKVELVMPRMILPAEESVEGQPDRPEAVQLQISKMVISNCRTDDCLSRASLQSVLAAYDGAKLLSETDFPFDDLCQEAQTIPEILHNHALDKDNAYLHPDVKIILSNSRSKSKSSSNPSKNGSNQQQQQQNQLSPPPSSSNLSPSLTPTHKLDCDSLKRLSSGDIWAFSAEQVWLEFLGVQNCKNRPVPFVEAIPVSVWISMSEYQKTIKTIKKPLNNNSTNASHANSSAKNQGHHVRIDIQRPTDRSSSPSSSTSHPNQPLKSSSLSKASSSSAHQSNNMPVLGSSPPVCDNSINFTRNNGHDSNSSYQYNQSSSSSSRNVGGQRSQAQSQGRRDHSSSSGNVERDYQNHYNQHQGYDPRDHRDSYQQQPSQQQHPDASHSRSSSRSSLQQQQQQQHCHSHSQRYEDPTTLSSSDHHYGGVTQQMDSPSSRASNSSSSKHRMMSEEDRRPSRLSISPDPGSGRGDNNNNAAGSGTSSSRRSRSTSQSQSQTQYRDRVDSPHGGGGDRKRSSRSSSSQDVNVGTPSSSNHPHHHQQHHNRYGSSSDVYPRRHGDDPASAAESDYHQQYQQPDSSSSRHRRERRLQREDSRSSSSPPISSTGRDRDRDRDRDSSRCRRDSIGVRERDGSSGGDVSVDIGRKTEARLMRQSSSSSSDRRGETMEGFNRNGDGWRDERSVAEGQDDDRRSQAGGGRRRSGEEVAYYGNRRDKEREGEKRTHSSREVASLNFRNNRQNSSSSSERGWTGQQAPSNRDRRMTRSSSRERRDLTYEMERQEIERSRDRGGGSRSNNNGDRERGDDRLGGGGYDHGDESDGKRWSYDDVRDQQRIGGRVRDSDCDYDNDVTMKGGRGSSGGSRRVRDLQTGSGGSRSRESSLTRSKERDNRGGRSGSNSSSGRYDGGGSGSGGGRMDRGGGFGVHAQERHPQTLTDSRPRSSERSKVIQDSRGRSSSSHAAMEYQGGEEGGRYSSSSSSRQRRYEVEDDEEEVGEEDEEEDIDQSFQNHHQRIHHQEQQQYDSNRNTIHPQHHHHGTDADNNNYPSHDSAGEQLYRHSAQSYPPPSSQSQEDGAWTHHSARPTPEGCKSQDDYHLSANNSIEKTEPVNRLCVLVSIDRKVRIQVTHYQYIFLLRLSESFSTFQAELSTDLVSRNNNTTNNPASNPSSNFHPTSSSLSSNRQSQMQNNHRIPKEPQYSSSSSSYNTPPPPGPHPPPPSETEIFVPLVLKELELAVVCPYQMHQRTFSDDLSIMSPFLGAMTGGQDAVFGDEGDNTCFPGLVDNRQGRRARDDLTLQRIQQTISFKSNSSGQLENISHLTPQSAFDSRGGVASSLTNSAFQTPGNVTTTTIAASSSRNASGGGSQASTLPFQSEWSSTIRKESSDTISQSAHSLGRDSGIGVERKSHQSSRGKSSAGGKGGVDNVKKSFTSAFSSFTDKIKNKMEGLDDGGGHDDLDTMSIRTDTSDDDFELMSLEDMEEAPAFAHQQPPPHEVPSAEDIYSEFVDQGDSVSVYAESSTTKGKEMVYIVLFKLDNTEVLANMDSSGMITCVQLAKLASLQLGNISYDDFYSRFSTEKGYIQEELSKIPSKKSSPLPPTVGPSNRCPIRLKFTVPAFDPTLNLPVDPGFMAVQVEDYCLQFKMSGLTCLSDFMEDEKIPETVPMCITVHNLLLVLEEDRPPANMTSPGSMPVNLCIKHICIDRTKDGMVHVSGPMAYSPMPNGGADNSNNTAFKFPSSPGCGSGTFPAASPASSSMAHKPQLVNHATSPMTSPDGTMALLMAAQNENVLLKRQLEEVRRANRLYEHQLLQWRDMQDNSSIASGGGGGSGVGITSSKAPFGKRQSFTSDMVSGSPSSSSGISEIRGGGATGSAGLMGNHVLQQPSHSSAMSDTSDAGREDMERENLRLQHQIVRLEDDLLTVSKEKESLLQTLKLLQDELLMSERIKRTKTK